LALRTCDCDRLLVLVLALALALALVLLPDEAPPPPPRVLPQGSTGKLVLALRPLMRTAASSYARAASSAVSKVPSHTLLLLRTHTRTRAHVEFGRRQKNTCMAKERE
jgi:hypothetical protein